jgi:hypothetical protein
VIGTPISACRAAFSTRRLRAMLTNIVGSYESMKALPNEAA